jgi:DNA-directed RNA polymerase II subunit RPB11
VISPHSQLLLNPSVLFAGYRVPHPLETNIELRLQTDSSSSTSPRAALQQACSDLIFLTRKLKGQFAEQARTAEIGANVGVGVGGGGAGQTAAGTAAGAAQRRAQVEDVYGGIPVGGEMLAASQAPPEDPYAF